MFKKNLLFLLFFISLISSYSSNLILTDSINEDSPQTYYFYLNMKDLNNVEVKNNFFDADFWIQIDSDKKIDKNLIEEDITIDYVKDDILEAGEFVVIESTSDKNQAYRNVTARFKHKWNLKNYPFDKPNLKIKFKSTVDTSYLRFKPNTDKFYELGSIENLKEGYIIENVTYSIGSDTNKNDYFLDDGSENDRLRVNETITYNFILEREGGWLFLKLFVGTYLSFLISWIVFLISPSDFGSRIELSVGAIFGAIGNMSYVESIIPDIQVLTKADIINNFSIIMIIFNIVLIVIQNNSKITFKFFEDNFKSAFFSLFLFISINLLIVLWPISYNPLYFIFLFLIILAANYYLTKYAKILSDILKKTH